MDTTFEGSTFLKSCEAESSPVPFATLARASSLLPLLAGASVVCAHSLPRTAEPVAFELIPLGDAKHAARQFERKTSPIVTVRRCVEHYVPEDNEYASSCPVVSRSHAQLKFTVAAVRTRRLITRPVSVCLLALADLSLYHSGRGHRLWKPPRYLGHLSRSSDDQAGTSNSPRSPGWRHHPVRQSSHKGWSAVRTTPSTSQAPHCRRPPQQHLQGEVSGIPIPNSDHTNDALRS